jgi:DNA helicase-2/ATP-dependent DNA helicase PcrA
VIREYQLRPAPGPPVLRIDYAHELNPQQLAAVTAAPGHALVLAGAGAGKTRTLTYRVAWLLEHGVPAERILLLTFTNKSAREMMQRVSELISGDLGRLWGGTFHSVGLRILRRHPDRFGYPPGFTVADREDAKDLLAACIQDAGVDPRATRFPKPEVVAEMFSRAANTGRTLRQILEEEHDSFVPLEPALTDIGRRYAERKRAAGLMDFDDLLILWLKLLRDHSDLRELYQRRFQYVLVDEYQDTNSLQGALLDELSALHGNLMAVGDDAQSIYSWRGANFSNILEFPRRHPNAQVFRIETNYRSTPEILALANAAIAANTRQFPKALQPYRASGMKPVLVPCNDGSEQAMFVVQRILELRDEGRRLDDICILYRSHFHALELQLELTRHNVPFFITSGIRFFEQAHIKDVAAYLKFVANPNDELAFKRLARMLPGVGGKSAEKLWTRLRGKYPCPVEPASNPESPSAPPVADNDGGIGESEAAPVVHHPPIAPLLAAIAGDVPKRALVAWSQFSATISQAEAPEIRSSPARLIRHVTEADYADYLETNYDNARRRLDDIEQLATYAEQFRSVPDFLSQLALQSSLEADEAARRDDEKERVRLSTVHQAKGLEFGVVVVIKVCDGSFPTQRSLDSLEALEEERRLFYVATTRAKDELYLTYPLVRILQGNQTLQPVSRFVQEVPQELMDEFRLRTYGAWSSGWAPPAPDGIVPTEDEEPF